MNEDRQYTIELNDGWIMQFGETKKKTAQHVVRFSRRFAEDPRPIVFVSPFWQLARRNVGTPETVEHIAGDHFDLVSGNAAGGGYFVSWMAIGVAAT